jgi:hypothetical protein
MIIPADRMSYCGFGQYEIGTSLNSDWSGVGSRILIVTNADSPPTFIRLRNFEKRCTEQVGTPANVLQALLHADPRIGFGLCLKLRPSFEYFDHGKL